MNETSLVLLFLHTFMCCPDEGPRRTETSHFLMKSLKLRCQVYVFIYIYIYEMKNEYA